MKNYSNIFSDGEIQDIIDEHIFNIKNRVHMQRCSQCRRLVNSSTIHKLVFEDSEERGDNVQMDYEVLCDVGHRSFGQTILSKNGILKVSDLTQKEQP